MLLDSVNYSKALLEGEFAARAPIRKALRELRDKYGVHRKHVAEFGSGVGYNLEEFAATNEVVGVEGLGEAVQRANERGIRTILGDLEGAVPLPSSAFDLVLCLDVLEHLVRPEVCVREAHRILRPGCIFVVNVPNHFSLYGRLSILRGRGVDSMRFFPGYADWQYPHLRFFRHTSTTELISASGFEVVEDWSGRFPAVPLLSRHHVLHPFASMLARKLPSLLAGGFFVIARRSP